MRLRTLDFETKENLFSTGQVLGFPVHLKSVLSQLQQDMRDDWYNDALGYNDIFSDQEYLADTILESLTNGVGLTSATVG